MGEEKIETGARKEAIRQLVHAIIGLFMIAIMFLLGRGYLIAFLFFVTIIGLLIINFRTTGGKFPIAEWFEKKLERNHVRFPGYGSSWYVVGIILMALVIHDQNEIAAGIFVLAVGDAASTIFGVNGTHKCPYNERKTLEGSAAFFAFSLIAFVFIGWKVIPLALIASIAESIPLPYDDNIMIPIVATAFFLLV